MLIASSLIVSFLLSLCLTPIAKGLALRLMILDVSDSLLKTHTRSTPYLGGLSIFASVLLASVLLIGWYRLTPSLAEYGLLLACFMIMGTGLLDDIHPLRPHTKLILQVMAAAVVWQTGTKVALTGAELFDMVITILWLVGLSNAFNLIDIMDGLASGVAAIASLFLAVLCLVQGEFMYAILLLSVAGACCGFLKYNFHPAQIFMGDTGSLFLGFIIACAAIRLFQYESYNQGYLVVMILGVPLFETIFLSVLRIKSGIFPWIGTADHFALRLLKLGLSVKRTVTFTYLFCLLLGAATLGLYALHSSMLYGFIAAACIFTLLGWLLAKAGSRSSRQA